MIIIRYGVRHAEGVGVIQVCVGDIGEFAFAVVQIQVCSAEVRYHHEVEVAIVVNVYEGGRIGASELLRRQAGGGGPIAKPPLAVIDQQRIAVTVIGIPVFLGHGFVRRAVLGHIQVKVTVPVNVAGGDGGGVLQGMRREGDGNPCLGKGAVRVHILQAGVELEFGTSAAITEPVENSVSVEIRNQAGPGGWGLTGCRQNLTDTEGGAAAVPKNLV